MNYRQLTCDDRIRIETLLKIKKSFREIARELKRSPSTISREVYRNQCESAYFNITANILSKNRRTKASEEHTQYLDEDWDNIENLLKLSHWSPEQIHGRLSRDNIPCPSHESIYQHIIKDKKNGGDLYLFLRRKKVRRKRIQNSSKRKGKIIDRVSIHNRPKPIENRERFGDFEGDLVIGKNHQGAFLTLIDRKSLYSKIIPLNNKESESVTFSICNALKELKPKSLTLDNGLEFSGHKSISENLGIPVFFADPYSSWQKGTVENFNGLIREFFPKKTNLKEISKEQVHYVESLLNHRPRKSLGFSTPYEFHFNKKTNACDFNKLHPH